MRKYFHSLVLALFLAVAFLGVALAGNPTLIGTAVVTVATDNDTSAALALPKNISKVVLYVPTIDSATVSLQVSANSGTTYDDLFCFNNGTNTVLWSTAAGTGGMYVEVPCDMYPYTHLKVQTGAGQTSDRSFVVYGVPQMVYDVSNR
jgi:hypothetical protein